MKLTNHYMSVTELTNHQHDIRLLTNERQAVRALNHGTRRPSQAAAIYFDRATRVWF